MMKILVPLGCVVLFYGQGMGPLVVSCFCFFSCFCLFPLLASPICYHSMMYLDGLSVVMILLTLWVGGLMYISSGGLKIKGFKEFYFIVSSLCLILVAVFSCSSLFVFYIFFEFSLIPITVMVLGWGYQPERLQASNYLVLYTVGASLPLLVSICYMFYLNGHCSFYLLGWGVPSFFNLSVWWGVTILAFLAKTPLYFLHLWLPKAHVEAPVAGSMVLAGVLLKLGGYGLLRLLVSYQYIGLQLCSLLSSVAIWGGVVCSLICLRQTDIKALIAYSSITHMGIMVGGFVSNSVWGWQGGLMMMLSHGLVSSSMFLGAYMMYKVYGTRSLYFIKGVMGALPLMAMIWFFSASANMGVPPTVNLQSEIMLVTSIVGMSYGFILPLSMSLFFSAAYSLFLYSSTQNGHLSGSLYFFYSLSFSDVVSMFLHLFPVFIILVKGDLLLSWLL